MGERTLYVYWCPICELQTERPWHPVGRAGLIPQTQEEHECERIEVVPTARLTAVETDAARYKANAYTNAERWQEAAAERDEALAALVESVETAALVGVLSGQLAAVEAERDEARQALERLATGNPFAQEDPNNATSYTLALELKLRREFARAALPVAARPETDAR